MSTTPTPTPAAPTPSTAAAPPAAPVGKPLRADAARNRARLLEVAEEVFTERGTGASTEEIAKAAGVGIATVFRNFPTKEALLEAVLVRRLERLVGEGRRLQEELPSAEALFGFFDLILDQAPVKNAFASALAAAGIDVHAAASQSGRDLSAVLTTLLRNAQAAGTVRDDLDVPELTAIIIGTGRMLEHLAEHPDPEPARRVRAVVVDGLRTQPRS